VNGSMKRDKRAMHECSMGGRAGGAFLFISVALGVAKVWLDVVAGTIREERSYSGICGAG
jgi:hypothetical protein